MTEKIERQIPVLRVPLSTILDTSTTVRLNGVLNGKRVDTFSSDDLDTLRSNFRVVVFDDKKAKTYTFNMIETFASRLHWSSYNNVVKGPDIRLLAVRKYRSRDEFWKQFGNDETFKMDFRAVTHEERAARHVLMAITWAATPTWARNEVEYNVRWTKYKNQIPFDDQFVWTPEFFADEARAICEQA